MAASVPAYDYFRMCLRKVYHTDRGDSVRIEAIQIDLSEIRQSFDYDRVKEMVGKINVKCSYIILVDINFYYRSCGKLQPQNSKLMRY